MFPSAKSPFRHCYIKLKNHHYQKNTNYKNISNIELRQLIINIKQNFVGLLRSYCWIIKEVILQNDAIDKVSMIFMVVIIIIKVRTISTSQIFDYIPIIKPASSLKPSHKIIHKQRELQFIVNTVDYKTQNTLRLCTMLYTRLVLHTMSDVMQPA